MSMMHIHPIPGIPNPTAVFKIFYGITGVGLAALLAGFSICLFDISQVDRCADYSVWAFDILKSFGDYVIQWFFALFEAIRDRV